MTQFQFPKDSPLPMRPIAGATLVEFIVIAPTLLMILLGLMQYATLFHAKSNLNYATFEAARAGSVNHAKPAEIHAAFTRAMTGYYGGGTTSAELLNAYQSANRLRHRRAAHRDSLTDQRELRRLRQPRPCEQTPAKHPRHPECQSRLHQVSGRQSKLRQRPGQEPERPDAAGCQPVKTARHLWHSNRKANAVGRALLYLCLKRIECVRPGRV